MKYLNERLRQFQRISKRNEVYPRFALRNYNYKKIDKFQGERGGTPVVNLQKYFTS